MDHRWIMSLGEVYSAGMYRLTLGNQHVSSSHNRVLTLTDCAKHHIIHHWHETCWFSYSWAIRLPVWLSASNVVQLQRRDCALVSTVTMHSWMRTFRKVLLCWLIKQSSRIIIPSPNPCPPLMVVKLDVINRDSALVIWFTCPLKELMSCWITIYTVI